MKKFFLRFNRLFLSSLLILLSACSNSMDEMRDPLEEFVTVTLNVDDLINTEESPMTRAYTSDDLIGIQVSTVSGDLPYAYGVFQVGKEMKLDLLAGSKYNFEYTIVKDALKYDNTMYNGKAPFSLSRTTNYSYNKFTKSGYYYIGLRSGNTCGASYPPLDRYYGEYRGYSPVKDGELTLNVKRTAFGMRFNVTGITDGMVTVTCRNDVKKFYEKSSSDDFVSEDLIFTWNDVRTAYQYGDSYSESVELSLTWVRGLGITQNLGTKTVTINNNAMNIFNISLGSDDGGAALGLVLENNPFSFESSSFKPWL